MKTLLALAFALIATAASAASDADKLSDPALEARARSLQKELRCLVCQGESLDESNAELARDLRHIVRERIAAGQSDEEIKAFLVARYGDFILMRPPMKPDTYLLWFGPAVLLLLGSAVIAVTLLKRGNEKASNP